MFTITCTKCFIYFSEIKWYKDYLKSNNAIPNSKRYYSITTRKSLIDFIITTNSRSAGIRGRRAAGDAQAGMEAATCLMEEDHPACLYKAGRPSQELVPPHGEENLNFQRLNHEPLSPAPLVSSCIYGSGTRSLPASVLNESNSPSVPVLEQRGIFADGTVFLTHKSALWRRVRVAYASCARDQGRWCLPAGHGPHHRGQCRRGPGPGPGRDAGR